MTYIYIYLFLNLGTSVDYVIRRNVFDDLSVFLGGKGEMHYYKFEDCIFDFENSLNSLTCKIILM